MEVIGVLYNDCYGGFGLTKHFIEEYTKRTGLVTSSFSIKRTDRVAVEIFNEKGSSWCSRPCSKIEIEYVPAWLEDYIEVNEYDGAETIFIDKHLAIYDKTKEYIETPTPEKLEWLKDQIRTIESAKVTMDENELTIMGVNTSK